MATLRDDKMWRKLGLSRRAFLRRFGLGASALTLSPYLIERFAWAASELPATRVFAVRNGDFEQNTVKLWELLGGAASHFDPDDVVVLKCNGQWPNQGMTHTGCIKALIDQILAVPGFRGEVHICDNVQDTSYTGKAFSWGADNRVHNWPDHNWTTLAQEFQRAGKPVAVKKWINTQQDLASPADGDGWKRTFSSVDDGIPVYFSYPIWKSAVPGSNLRLDVRDGVWESGGYTGRRVKTIYMPTLNNHGNGSQDPAGVTGALKSFFGATEIHGSNGSYNHDGVAYRTVHGASVSRGRADLIGELAGRYHEQAYTPHLFVTTAMWAGWHSRTGEAAETKTLLACTDPGLLDYVACRDVIGPYQSFLDPRGDNHTRQQIEGYMRYKKRDAAYRLDATQIEREFEIVAYDFGSPRPTRLDIQRQIRAHRDGLVDEQTVLDTLRAYLESP